MRVLISAQYFPPDMGGGATRAYNAAKGLLKAGCTVTVVSAFPHYPKGNIPSEYRWKPLSVEFDATLKIMRTFVLPLSSEGFAKRVLLFASFVISSLFALPFIGKVDVVWSANPNVIGVIPCLVYKLANRCKVVQNVDDLWPEALYDLGVDKKSWLAKIGEFTAKIVYQLSSGITPISPAYVDVLLNKYAVDPRKIFVVPAGVDIHRYYCAKKRADSSSFRVLYIGTFSPAYDFDQVFRAAEITACANVNFTIQGGGELADQLKRKQMETRLKNIFVVDKIVSRDKVAKIMCDADALLLPLNGGASIEMGISSKLYEYQAAEKPILCCSRGQAAKYVRETKSGIVVEPGDYRALAEAVLFLKQNPNIACTMGLSGKSFVENNLSTEKLGFKMKKIFEKLTQDSLAKE